MIRLKQIIAFSVFAVCFLAISVYALAFPIPDTGQTQSYTETFGEDHDYTINPPSYTKLDARGNALLDSASSWSMVKDNVTGLMWEMKTDDNSIHDKDKTYNWGDAQSVFIKELNDKKFGGFSDWRLPTIKELSSIVNSGTDGTVINTAYFPNTVSSYYWSSTTYASVTSYAWSVYFGNGCVGHDYDKSSSYYVRAVRGGQSGSLNNLVINGDGTVTDTSTGLIWQQQTAGPMTWEAAINYCEGLSLGGYNDWRLPNRNELQSIVDYTRYSPAIDTAVFPGGGDYLSSYYWSSSTYANNNEYAWGVYFGNDVMGGVGKVGSHYVHAVRGVKAGPLDNLAACAPEKFTLTYGKEVFNSEDADRYELINSRAVAPALKLGPRLCLKVDWVSNNFPPNYGEVKFTDGCGNSLKISPDRITKDDRAWVKVRDVVEYFGWEKVEWDDTARTVTVSPIEITIKINNNDGKIPLILSKGDLTVRWNKTAGTCKYFVSLYDLGENEPVTVRRKDSTLKIPMFEDIEINQLNYIIKPFDTAKEKQNLVDGHQYEVKVSTAKGGTTGKLSRITFNTASQEKKTEQTVKLKEKTLVAAKTESGGWKIHNPYEVKTGSKNAWDYPHQKLAQLHAHYEYDLEQASSPPIREWKDDNGKDRVLNSSVKVSLTEGQYAKCGYSYVCITEHNKVAPAPASLFDLNSESAWLLKLRKAISPDDDLSLWYRTWHIHEAAQFDRLNDLMRQIQSQIQRIKLDSLDNLKHIEYGNEITMTGAFHLLAIGMNEGDLILPTYTEPYYDNTKRYYSDNTKVIEHMKETEVVKYIGKELLSYYKADQEANQEANPNPDQRNFINYLRDEFREDAITAVIKSGGIPIAAHPKWAGYDSTGVGGVLKYIEGGWDQDQLKNLAAKGVSCMEIYGAGTGFASKFAIEAHQAEIAGLNEKIGALFLALQDTRRLEVERTDERTAIDSWRKAPHAIEEWDAVLSNGGKIWGVATDDYTPNTGVLGINSFPGFGHDKGCIRILSDKTENSKAELMECLSKGRFYATQGSKGPRIDYIVASFDSGKHQIDVKAEKGCQIRFIKSGGIELKQDIALSSKNSPLVGYGTYTCNGTEGYVRIEVIQGSLKSWSQPIFISKLPSSSTTSKSTRKRATEIIPSATLALCDATLAADASDGTKIDGYTIAPFDCPASSSPSSGYIGHIYYFTADADDESLSDIGLTITYKDSDLYVNPNRLAIYQYDPAAESWAELPSTIDTASHTVTANPYSLGLFALSAIDEEDFVSPDVAFETAVDGAILYEPTTIKVQASDYNSVSRVGFYLDGILLDTDNSAEDGWTTTLDPRLITAGTHTLTAEAIDDADNSNQAEITIAIPEDVAAKPPVVTITSPPDGSKVSGQTTLAGTVIAASIAYVAAVVDETPMGWAEIDEQGNWTIALDMTILDNGQHVVSIIAADVMGAQTTANINLDIENNLALQPPQSCNGDLNEDGEITPSDALIIFKCYLGSCTDCDCACADVNQDGEVTPADALCIFKKYLGQPSCLD